MARNRRKSKKIKWRRRFIFLLFIGIAAGFGVHHYRPLFPQDKPVFPTIKPPKKIEKQSFCGVSTQTIDLPRDSYAKAHRPAAKSLADSVHIRNKAQLDELIRDRRLYSAIEGLGFIISREKLKHSYSVLHPKALTALEEMGAAFAERLVGTSEEGSVFAISSLTRTHQQQKELRKINKAATSKKSTHSYGASFDIWAIYSPNGNCRNALPILESVLKDFRQKKQILLCPEGQCIHITAI